MRYAIIADIHANLAAFTAVLEDMDSRGGAEEVWCLGDVVGYGPDPHRCLELLHQFKCVCVAGNHDWAAIGKLDTLDFSPDAAAACHWTANRLIPDDIHYIESLPLVSQKAGFTLVHGSPREPLREYLLSTEAADQNLGCFRMQYCLVGHSHIPLVFECSEGGACSWCDFPDGAVLSLADRRLIINPGGVGQPRDGDPRASYAIYDSETNTISHYRIPYDIAATQARMMECGLPLRLVRRLSYGV